jgi:hypothetical protein
MEVLINPILTPNKPIKIDQFFSQNPMVFYLPSEMFVGLVSPHSL